MSNAGTLEDLLREAAAKGLTHLTLYPVDSNDGKSTYWNARATPSTMHSYIQVANYDPVEAVRLVLEALPRAPRRTPKKITATVTDPEPIVMDESKEALAKVDDEWSKFK